MIRNSFSPHTWLDYLVAWNRWLSFYRSFDFHCYQHSKGAVLSFLCILMHNHRSHSHITMILVGISDFFKLHSLPPLNVLFSDKQAVEGYRKSTFSPDKRRPISIEMLKQLCLSTGQVCHNQFKAFLFQAGFCLTFFAAR